MAGSRGIFLVHNDAEFKRAVKDSSKLGDSGKVLVEEYLVGPEVSVELIVKNGKAHAIQVTDKTTSGAPPTLQKQVICNLHNWTKTSSIL